jgi:ornithine carbamoyltransferase
MRHFLRLLDLSPHELRSVLDDAARYKTTRGASEHPKPLHGKSVAILLEKASTRTRISFEVGVHELGGMPITLVARDTQLGRGEPLEDTARMFSGYVHAVVYRTSEHARAQTLADHATVPVINGLSDLHHPCQILADLQTVHETVLAPTGQTWSDLRVAWIGDGNNVAHSWVEAAAMLGFELRIACPRGYEPDAQLMQSVRQGVAQQPLHSPGFRVSVMHDADEAARGAHVVTTDVWASMGQEQEQARRAEAFALFTVTQARMKLARPDAIFLHCLPAHRGEEVDASVIDGPQSQVWSEAENRLHAQKALLDFLVHQAS